MTTKCTSSIMHEYTCINERISMTCLMCRDVVDNIFSNKVLTPMLSTRQHMIVRIVIGVKLINNKIMNLF